MKELNVFSFTEYCIPFLTTISIPPNPENKIIFISEENFWCRKINAISSRVLTVKMVLSFLKRNSLPLVPPPRLLTGMNFLYESRTVFLSQD